MQQRFSDKVVVITGASSGIGAAAARQFAAEGARVVLAARTEQNLRHTARAIGDERIALAVPTDVTQVDGAAMLLERAFQHFGAIHILVNSAGVNVRGALETRGVTELARIVDVNLRAPVLLSRLVLPYLRRAGGGAIVNVASLAGRIPLPDEATYSATKFGLRVFSMALAEELRGSGISVSAVSPGPVDTGFISANLDEVPNVVFSQPMSTAEEIAALILDCAFDGRRERVKPLSGGYLTTFGYLVPGFARLLRPFLEKRGQARKQRYKLSVRQRS